MVISVIDVPAAPVAPTAHVTHGIPWIHCAPVAHWTFPHVHIPVPVLHE